MAESLPVLEARLEALYEAQSSGALKVKHGDTEVTYRSMEELNRAIAIIIGKINKLNGTVRKPVYVQQNTKGL